MTKKSLFFILTLTVALCSCGKKTSAPEERAEAPEPQLRVTNHTWYYFSPAGFVRTDRPKSAPVTVQLPWTEAVRISSSNCAEETVENDTKAFAVVNRLGILCFNESSFTLAGDDNLFPDRTAGKLVFFNNTPLFSVYKSAFFNDTITAPDYQEENAPHLFLVQFDDSTKISYPVVNCNNIIGLPNSEVTDFSWYGDEWICSVKTITDVRNYFTYIKWKPSAPLLSLSPSIASQNILTEETDVYEFRGSKEPADYRLAPERLKKLLSGFDTNRNFEVDIKAAGGQDSRRYINDTGSTGGKTLFAKGIISKSWSAVLFEDGTLYLEGALPGKYILRGGKAVAIRLPRLPAGFVYSDFVISGTYLYAAWEETAFYKTGRSGFLSVNLDKTLYAKDMSR